MDRPVTGAALPDWVRPLATQIEREMDDLDREFGPSGPATRDDEKAMFAAFEDYLTVASRKYDSLTLRKPDRARDGAARLVFQALYNDALKPPAEPDPPDSEPLPELDDDEDEDPLPRPSGPGRPVLLSALMAAMAESLGPLRLTQLQSTGLAEVFHGLGQALDDADLLVHAAAAYEGAARLYKAMDDDEHRDRALRKLASVRHRAMPRGWGRRGQALNALLFGYGFEPYRFLAWMGVQLVVACAFLALLPYDHTIVHGGRLSLLYLGLQDFVNPMGLGDTYGISRWIWGVLVVESYAGLISSSVFFSLLLRRWFRA